MLGFEPKHSKDMSIRTLHRNWHNRTSCSCWFSWHHSDCVCQCILGSSLRDLPQQLKQRIRAKELHIRRKPSASASSNRHLRQYAKAGENLAWGFHSSRFLTKGFYPVNPLSYSEHASSTTRNGRIKNVLASFVLKCLAYQTVRKEDIDHMFSIAITDSVLAKYLGRSIFFIMAKDHIQAQDGSDSYTSIMLQHMQFLEDIASCQ